LTCVRAKGNAVCDACRLRWEMNIFKRILTGIAENVVGVTGSLFIACPLVTLSCMGLFNIWK